VTTPTKPKTWPGFGPIARQWDVGLHRSFPCAGRVCWVRLASLREDDGAPRFEVTWAPPGPPLRMLPADIARFEACKREAEAEICTHLETLR
jgi:hypothetical protein